MHRCSGLPGKRVNDRNIHLSQAVDVKGLGLRRKNARSNSLQVPCSDITCRFRTANATDMMRHITSCHDRDEFQCPACDRYFSFGSALDRHIVYYCKGKIGGDAIRPRTSKHNNSKLTGPNIAVCKGFDVVVARNACDENDDKDVKKYDSGALISDMKKTCDQHQIERVRALPHITMEHINGSLRTLQSSASQLVESREMFTEPDRILMSRYIEECVLAGLAETYSIYDRMSGDLKKAPK